MVSKPESFHNTTTYLETTGTEHLIETNLRKELKINLPFIFHGFNKNEQLAQQIISQNCFLSFGKNLLANKNLQTTFANLSNNQFFLENDANDISIEEIYTFAANLRKITIKELRLLQAENWKTIFGYEVQSS
jgi:TatD DNase family protein